MKKLLTLILFAALCAAQSTTSRTDGTSVKISKGPNDTDYTKRYESDVNGNLIYLGVCSKKQPKFTWLRSTGELVNISVSGTTATATFLTAHGLEAANPIEVANFTTDTDLNGTYYINATPTATTLTFTVSGVTAATYTDSGGRVASTACRSTAAMWKITLYFYDLNNNPVREVNSEFDQIWDNRTVSTGATKVTYQ